MKQTVESVDFTIRPAETRDTPMLVEMVERIGRNYPSGYNRGWIGSADGLAYVRYHIEKGWVAVAERGDALIGHCAWSVKQGQPHQAYVRFAELQTLFVRPEVRGNGAAEALITAFNHYCETSALSVQMVHAVPDPKVIAVFQKMGFLEERRLMVRKARD